MHSPFEIRCHSLGVNNLKLPFADCEVFSKPIIGDSWLVKCILYLAVCCENKKSNKRVFKKRITSWKWVSEKPLVYNSHLQFTKTFAIVIFKRNIDCFTFFWKRSIATFHVFYCNSLKLRITFTPFLMRRIKNPHGLFFYHCWLLITPRHKVIYIN